MRALEPELICPGHGEYLPCAPEDIEAYGDFIARKERVFRALVDDPPSSTLFWARLLPYLATVAPGAELEYEVRLRNNLGRRATFGARLLAPPGWRSSAEHATLDLEAGRAVRCVSRPSRRSAPSRAGGS